MKRPYRLHPVIPDETERQRKRGKTVAMDQFQTEIEILQMRDKRMGSDQKCSSIG